MSKSPRKTDVDGKPLTPPPQDYWPTLQPSKSKAEGTGAKDLFGDYELLQEIARGGMGVVFKARQRGLQRTVALKMILSGPTATEEDVQRFCLEARSAANLDHPNIVPVYEIGQQDNLHYFTMAFIEGDSLSGLIKNKGIVLSFKETAAIVAAIAEAIAYAHEQGIIHRDLKPENILIDLQGRPRITDFGLAKRLEINSGITASGQILGTPSYMAPEQAKGSPTTSPAVDIYALGGILYFLLTHRPPFAGASLLDTLRQVVEVDPVKPRQINPTVPQVLEAICLKCLRKKPSERYATAGALAEALGAWCKGSQTEFGDQGGGFETTLPLAARIKAASQMGSPLPHSMKVAVAPVRRRLPWRWIAGLGILAGLAGTVAYFVRWSDPPTANHSHAIEDKGKADPQEQTVPIVGAPDVAKLGKLRHEFGVKIEFKGGTPGPNGERLMIEGTRVSFQIETERDAYIGIWDIDADGTITQLFPNKFQSDNLVRAGKVYTLPGKPDPGRKDYIFDTIPSGGLDHYWVLASTHPWEGLQATYEGPFKVFRTAEAKEQWRRNPRGTRVNPVSPEPETEEAISEEVFPYRVRAKE